MSSYIELSLSDDIHPKVRIEMNMNMVNIETVLEDLIKPALLASGFVQSTINKVVILDENLE